MGTLLEVKGLCKTYRRGRRGTVEALRDVSFSLPESTCLGLVGESGCGKSTLCRLLTGLERPTAGQILYRGKPVRPGSGAIQMVFQNSLDAVASHMDVFHIISEPLENLFRLRKKGREQEVERLLELVGLHGEDMRKYPRQFSGGQLQRICIARALAARPELLLLDEPLSSLDVSVQAQLLNLLGDLKKQMELTCLLISHDLEAVYYLSDAVLVMYGGCLMEQIDDIRNFSNLCHPYTRSLLAAHGMEADEKVPLLSGEAQASGCPYAPRCQMADALCQRERPVLSPRGDGCWIACHHV